MQLLIHAATLLCVAAVQRRSDTNSAAGVHSEAKQMADDGDPKVLPSESPLLASSQDAYKAIETKVSGLEELLASQEQQALNEIRSRKNAFQESLLAQHAKNSAVFDMNTRIDAEINATQNAIQGLRKDASKIREENQVLSATLETLSRNISIAQEFALESLKVSKERLHAAPELQILSDLNAHDADDEHKKTLDNFAVGVSQSHLSMLRIVHNEPDAHELIAHLDSRLNVASAEKNASLAKLSQSFDKLWKDGESHHEELIKQQQQLNETLRSTKIVKDKVAAAVEHLTSTKNRLSERVKALRAFGQTLATDVKTVVPITENETATSTNKYFSLSKTLPPMVQTLGTEVKTNVLKTETETATSKTVPPVMVPITENKTATSKTVPPVALMANNRTATSKANIKKPKPTKKHGKPAYQLQANGADGCQDGLEIKTLAECEQAVAALALSKDPAFNRHHPNIPQWCSYKQNGQCEKSQCMHFNAGGVGKGRKDLAPLCRSS